MNSLNRHSLNNGFKKPIKILQFGEGNFLRGFADWMFDIINERTGFNAGIQIVQPLENGFAELINIQDGLYHVLLEGIENGKKTQNFRLITSVNGVINPYENYKVFLELGENPDLEFIVSNTTEAGIAFNPEDNQMASTPNSFPAKLTALLYHRYLYFNASPPKNLIILPCELIEDNGNQLKKCIFQYIDLWELPESFKNSIEQNITFCNTLVDRIVPGFPVDRIETLQNKIGYKDQLIVSAEQFHLWVIEGPDLLKEKLHISLSKLNILVTKNLNKYRTRKVRILNGAHTIMVAYGLISGFKKVSDLIEDETAVYFIKDIIFNEIIPTLSSSKNELEEYAHNILERFQNPFIEHYLENISLNSVSKFKVRVLPSIKSYIDSFEKIPTGLATAFAYLIYMYKGKHEHLEYVLRDDEKNIALFKEAWLLEDEKLIAEKVLSNTQLWDEDLSSYEDLLSFIAQKLKDLINSNPDFVRIKFSKIKN